MIHTSMASAVRATNGRKVSINNKKMPGSNFATDPFQCSVGAKLRDVSGSTCSKCYAIRLAKLRPGVALGYARNEAELRRVAMLPVDSEERADWVAGIANQIERQNDKTGNPYHRWFDAGDLHGWEMLQLLADIARATPAIYHWIPTREVGAVRDYALRHGVKLAQIDTRYSQDRSVWRFGLNRATSKAGAKDLVRK